MKKLIIIAAMLLPLAGAYAQDSTSLQNGGQGRKQQTTYYEYNNEVRYSVSTNTVDWLYFVTPNIEIQYAMSQHWSIDASARVNAWSFNANLPFEDRQDKEMKVRQQTYALGLRYWTWTVCSGWWLGAKAQYSEYDNGGVAFLPWVPNNEAGEAIGVGAELGYAYQLSKHWDLNFGLGVWSGVRRYTTYDCAYCGQTVDKGKKGFFLPNEALLSLVYIF